MTNVARTEKQLEARRSQLEEELWDKFKQAPMDDIVGWFAQHFQKDDLYELLGCRYFNREDTSLQVKVHNLESLLNGFGSHVPESKKSIVYEYIVHMRNDENVIVDSGLFSSHDVGTSWAAARCKNSKHDYKSREVWLRHNLVEDFNDQEEID